MGSSLVRRAVGSVWPDPRLSNAARVVLIKMASHAVDGDEEPVYFAGWESLAIVLGYPDPVPNSAAERAVSRAVKELVLLGLVSVDPRVARSHKRRYRLRLPGP